MLYSELDKYWMGSVGVYNASMGAVGQQRPGLAG